VIKEQMDNIYKSVPLDKIPWNNETPPPCLLELIESGKVKPCKTIDLGCGAGNNALYLASKNFEVTGIDISSEAIRIAKQHAENKKLRCNFIAADMLGNLIEISETFDFAYDYEVLHHIFPEQRNKYAENVNKLLKPGAKYLSVCFSEKDIAFGSSEKYRKTPLDTELYFSSEEELEALFINYFNILELKTIEIKGKTGNHLAIYALMTRE
jgi:2-polyprenyl-3-methyl-5-hydroxy-6-metoxy-1,4-benzoquinol methylase